MQITEARPFLNNPPAGQILAEFVASCDGKIVEILHFL
jgi:hypothetical protein